MTVFNDTIQHFVTVSWVWLRKADLQPVRSTSAYAPQSKKHFDLLFPLRQWIDHLDVRSSARAHWICRSIPARCPFEREVKLFGKTLFSIPPLCKLNPFYNELVYLRFRALSYLADECGEDVSEYV
ncbi:MAG: Mo-dependent nitrogenase C-terminal domain-containing protein [Cyanobacteria bacterium SID2]|nr:Mo-dependent nitrogenase C-terminal domain-containing protein [Cyanobacteria bacterium SID2]MBP0002526.1 Mo-dependent nitrogenase C-terminal domain-containing protein [Cyanobacteria bacterium SBC]